MFENQNSPTIDSKIVQTMSTIMVVQNHGMIGKICISMEDHGQTILQIEHYGMSKVMIKMPISQLCMILAW
jgi:hypothetical protein